MHWYISHCIYCGKPYVKLNNKTLLCSDECRHKSIQDSKAKYQRKRRKLIRDGVLISNETAFIGTTFLSKHPNPNFKKEYKSIQKERKRIGVLS